MRSLPDYVNAEEMSLCRSETELVNIAQHKVGARNERGWVCHFKVFFEIQRHAIKFLTQIAIHQLHDHFCGFSVAFLTEIAHEHWSVALRQEWNLECEFPFSTVTSADSPYWCLE